MILQETWHELRKCAKDPTIGVDSRRRAQQLADLIRAEGLLLMSLEQDDTLSIEKLEKQLGLRFALPNMWGAFCSAHLQNGQVSIVIAGPYLNPNGPGTALHAAYLFNYTKELTQSVLHEAWSAIDRQELHATLTRLKPLETTESFLGAHRLRGGAMCGLEAMTEANIRERMSEDAFMFFLEAQMSRLAHCADVPESVLVGKLKDYRTRYCEHARRNGWHVPEPGVHFEPLQRLWAQLPNPQRAPTPPFIDEISDTWPSNKRQRII